MHTFLYFKFLGVLFDYFLDLEHYAIDFWVGRYVFRCSEISEIINANVEKNLHVKKHCLLICMIL